MYRGNFCLTKGDETVPAQKLVESPPAPYLSSSVHRVLQEHHATDKSTLLTESDIHDPRLYPITQGHKVNGAALCPSSLYADMALTIVRYMLQANNMPADDIGLNCANMKVDRSLIASPDSTSQLLRVSASADWSRCEVSLALFSVNAESQKIADHAICTVKVTQAPAALWLQDWNRLAHLIQGRISSLQKSVDEGDSHKLKRGLTYKLFSSFVEYANAYQGMQVVILNTEGFEATARVVFQTGDDGFSWNPCWIDSLGHIAGFIMNGNENIHTKDHVFVNHGWSGMRCAKKIEYDKTYQTYNKMLPQDDKGNVYVGDTYILENGIIVAIFEGVKFQRVPRSVLDHLLPSKGAPNVAGAQQRSVQKKSIPTPDPKVVPRNLSPAPVPVQSTIIIRLKEIIAAEAGIDIGELDSDISFADFGIDSLLSITISSRVQDELGLNLPSSSFSDFPTLNDVIDHFVPSERTLSYASVNSTPHPEEDENDLGDKTEATSVDSEPEVMATVRATIAEEVGIPLEELTATTDLLDLGVDSLLSLTIIEKLNQLDIEIPSNLLAENHTLQEIEKTLFQNDMLPQPRAPHLPVVEQDILLDRLTPTAFDGPPHATSVRLQGSSKDPRRILWLFPDGAGAATSYSSLPAISPDTVVHGLNCPWLKTPEDLRCSLPHYVSKFITEIRRRQPVGPYNFGGWSAGGILAYEAAQQLARQGQKTAKLILLDSPNPVGIQSPPKQMYDFLESLDMFAMSGRKPPSWLRPHFTAFIKMLDQYHPVAFSTMATPMTHIIYARDGLCKNPGDPRPELPEGGPEDTREMQWLLNNRTNFSGGGWRDLVGEKNLRISVVDEANHYTMLRTTETARKVSQLIASYLAS